MSELGCDLRLVDKDHLMSLKNGINILKLQRFAAENRETVD